MTFADFPVLAWSAVDNCERPLIGVFGGTFDPIHYGHLRIAEEIAETADLREMRFIPAGIPRLRCDPRASLQHRVEMVNLAIHGNYRFVLDEREVKRGGISYSVETLRELKQEMGQSTVLCLVTGADAFLRLAEWHRWRELFELCHFIVAARPGHTLVTDGEGLTEELAEECAGRWARDAKSLKHALNGLVYVAQTTLLEISATVIRRRIAAGKSIRYLMPEAIRDYIAANGLYLE